PTLLFGLYPQVRSKFGGCPPAQVSPVPREGASGPKGTEAKTARGMPEGTPGRSSRSHLRQEIKPYLSPFGTCARHRPSRTGRGVAAPPSHGPKPGEFVVGWAILPILRAF